MGPSSLNYTSELASTAYGRKHLKLAGAPDQVTGSSRQTPADHKGQFLQGPAFATALSHRKPPVALSLGCNEKTKQNKQRQQNPRYFHLGKDESPLLLGHFSGLRAVVISWEPPGSACASTPAAPRALPRKVPGSQSSLLSHVPAPPRRACGSRRARGAPAPPPPPPRLRSPAGRRGQPRGQLRGSAPPRFPRRPAGPARSCRPRLPPHGPGSQQPPGCRGPPAAPLRAAFPRQASRQRERRFEPAGPGQGERLPLSLASRWLLCFSEAVAGTAKLSLQLAGRQFQQTVVRGSPALLHTAVLPAECGEVRETCFHSQLFSPAESREVQLSRYFAMQHPVCLTVIKHWGTLEVCTKPVGVGFTHKTSNSLFINLAPKCCFSTSSRGGRRSVELQSSTSTMRL